MIEICPNALYSRADLADLLIPAGVDVDHFIARLRPRKVFKMLWLGEDILEALRKAPSFSDRSKATGIPKAPSRANRGSEGAAARSDEPGAKLLREFVHPGEGRP